MIEILVAIAFFGIIAFISANISGVLGPKSDNPTKETPFECGSPLLEKFSVSYTPIYFFVAIAFLIFDVEASYLLMWALILRGVTDKLTLLIVGGLFFLVIIIAFAYIWKKGGFEWE